MLITNNDSTLGMALESIRGLPAHLLVGSLSTIDKGINICERFGAEIIKITEKDRSKARNYLVSQGHTPWQLWLEPWEFIIQGQEAIKEIAQKESDMPFRINVFEKEIITKQTRLWPTKLNLKFTNPVFETLLTNTESTPLPVSLWTDTSFNNDRNILLEEWYKKKPADLEPNYYMACSCFSQQKYKDFLSLAEQYVFKQKRTSITNTMMRYYIGMVHCYVTKNISHALQQTIICLAQNPLMAEFWCLAGDIHVQTNEYSKAIAFYENAILLGSKRLQDDAWPIHLSKYKTYPEEMIMKCQNLLSNSKILYSTLENNV